MLCIPGTIAGFDENQKPVHLHRVTCTGSEASLFNCSLATTDGSACVLRSNAGVNCQGAQKSA